MAERPLVVLDHNRNGGDDLIYANREGLLELRKLIDQVLAENQGDKVAVYQNGNWHWLCVVASTQSDFDCGAPPCACGCQLPFVDVEKAYQESP